MSGIKPSAGPERPQEKVVDAQPLYQERGAFSGMNAKIVTIAVSVFIGVMAVLALIFCIIGAVRSRQPKYFLLILNLILSAIITGLLIFWYFRGTLVSSMIWYIFVQCVFYFFQCVTTDVFAWYEATTDASTITRPWDTIGKNCSHTPQINSCNDSNNTLSEKTYEYFLNI